MNTFCDAKGRCWHVVIDDAAIERVRVGMGIDLTRIARGELPIPDFELRTFVGLLYAVLCPELLSRGVTPQEFGRSLADPKVTERHLCAFFGAIEYLAPFWTRKELRAAGKRFARSMGVETPPRSPS